MAFLNKGTVGLFGLAIPLALIHALLFGQPAEFDAEHKVTAEWLASQSKDVVLIDAREGMISDRVEGAVQATSADLSPAIKVVATRPDQDSYIMAVFCSTAECDLSRSLAGEIRRATGSTNVFWVEGGVAAVRKHLRPTDAGNAQR